jgi:hypothetical protein
MHRYITRLGLGIVVALACSLAMIAEAQTTYSWNNNGTFAFWNSAGNWSPSGVPGNGDTADIFDIDAISRTISYNYTGPAITLGKLDLDSYGFGATNTLQLAVNNLSATYEYVGDYGMGSIDQSGGVNSMAGLYIGYQSGSTGTYDLSGGGTLSTVPGGGEWVGFNGTGVFNQTGGTNNLTSGPTTLELVSKPA